MPKTVVVWHREVPREEQQGKWIPITINGQTVRLSLGEKIEVSDKLYSYLTEKIPVYAFGEVRSLDSSPRVMGSMTRFEVETL